MFWKKFSDLKLFQQNFHVEKQRKLSVLICSLSQFRIHNASIHIQFILILEQDFECEPQN